jgi:hypothetical protein
MPSFWPLMVLMRLLVSGCATLSKEECMQPDWYGIEYEDGARGYKTSHIAKYRKVCSKYGVILDFDVLKWCIWGLNEYCTPAYINRALRRISKIRYVLMSLKQLFLPPTIREKPSIFISRDIRENKKDLDLLYDKIIENRLIHDGIKSKDEPNYSRISGIWKKKNAGLKLKSGQKKMS